MEYLEVGMHDITGCASHSAIASQQSAQSGKYYLVNDTLITAIGEWDKSPHNITKILELLRKYPIDFNMAARQQELGKHPMKCNLMELCKFASWSKDLSDSNSEWYCSTPNCQYRNNPDTRYTGESPICKICRIGEQEPFCIGCERLSEHDTAIREDERKKILYAITVGFVDELAGRESLTNTEIRDVITTLRSAISTTNDHDYQCGDNCHGECSGEYDGKIHCPETEPEKRGGE